ncbi:MAG: hypothetical protein HZA34_00030 [Candidatus Pacebacteria bacterium]|nr:hypothetical protein [Candidatus Paceibacterota bacterium]
MNNLKIKQIESLGGKLGLKEKPIVVNKGILFVAGFLSFNGFKTHISDGIVNKDVFLSPCIVLEIKKKPKLRFKNQVGFFEKYLAQAEKKNVKQLNNKQYCELINLARKEGESNEYAEWRKESLSKITWVKKLLSEYNKTRKNLDKKERFSFLEFEDGTIRLNFGNTTNENLGKNTGTAPLSDKKKKLRQFLSEFVELKKYLIEHE